MASEDSTGSGENPAGTIDDSTDDQILATTGFESKIIEECSLEVSQVAGDFVTVHFSDELFSGRLFIPADQADRLADELHDHADAVREYRDRDGEP
jgi:hypothetical protein